MKSDRKQANLYTISLTLIYMHYLKIDSLGIATIKTYLGYSQKTCVHFQNLALIICSARCLMR